MNEWSTMKKLIWLKRTALGGTPFVWKTESGEAPLTLEGALTKRIKSLTQYGLCTQASTPTPNDPVDIVCNNGVLKARHQSGLPLGYQRVEYLRSRGTQYIDLGYKGNGNTKVKIKK